MLFRPPQGGHLTRGNEVFVAQTDPVFLYEAVPSIPLPRLEL